MSRPSKHAHYLVKETAEAMARELYDTVMQNDFWYAYWKRQNPGLEGKALEDRFVQRNLARLLPQARATLAKMLAEPGDSVLKEQIYDALLKDATLVRGRNQ